MQNFNFSPAVQSLYHTCLQILLTQTPCVPWGAICLPLHNPKSSHGYRCGVAHEYSTRYLQIPWICIATSNKWPFYQVFRAILAQLCNLIYPVTFHYSLLFIFCISSPLRVSFEVWSLPWSRNEITVTKFWSNWEDWTCFLRKNKLAKYVRPKKN